MKRLQVFNTNPEYNSAKDIFKYPTVAHIKENLDTKFMNEEEYYSKQYLTFEALEDCVFTLTIYSTINPTACASISYSIDDGNTWTTIQNGNGDVTITTELVSKGNKILWKGIARQLGAYTYDGNSNSNGLNFRSTGKYKIYGNSMSLFYNNDFNNKYEFPIVENTNTNGFGGMFRDSINLVSAKNLILPVKNLNELSYCGMFERCTSLINAPKLPATSLANSCYKYMFRGCSSLIVAPNLPAKILDNYCYCNMFTNCASLIIPPLLNSIIMKPSCYSGMFSGCTSLTIAPELPATTLANDCYSRMFNGCTALTTAPALPVTTLANYCYQGMFRECTSLVTAPELPATILTQSCYGHMFEGCTSLIATPNLPATILVDNCYQGMFRNCTSLVQVSDLPALTMKSYCYAGMFSGCTSLTSAPELPAIILAPYCYGNTYTGQYETGGMFEGCTSLTTAPELPATTLTSNCYSRMFSGCSNLNYIKAMFINTPGSSYTQNWVQGVSSTGTFIKNSEAEWNVSGQNGIPENWTINIQNPDISNYNYFYTKAIDNCIFTLTLPAELSISSFETISYSINNGQTWISTNNINNQQVTITTPTITSGNKVYWKGLGAIMGTHDSNKELNSVFSSTGKYEIGGNIMTLLLYNENYVYPSYGLNSPFQYLFCDSTNLISAKNLNLSVNHLRYAYGCYRHMFKNCISLIDTPNLLNMAITQLGCEYMFENCISLVNVSESCPTSTYEACYASMFAGCTSLIKCPKLPATLLSSSCYRSMFKGCTSLTIAPELPATSLNNNCYYHMFEGCTSLINAPELPSKYLSFSCYEGMFQDCISLVNAPELPATSLASRCYDSMFRECTSLVNAPELPATWLTNNCYNNMFQNCTNLKYIKALFTTTPSNSYTQNWVKGVSSTGTFIQNINATWAIVGDNGIPTGWQPGIEWPENYNYFASEAIDNCQFTLKIAANTSIVDINYVEYSVDSCETWTRGTNINNQEITITTPNISAGNKVYWRGKGIRIGNSSSNVTSIFSSTGRYNIEGNIYSFISCNLHNNNNTNYKFARLFVNSTNLISAENLIIDKVYDGCCHYMFSGCTALIKPPAFYNIPLASYCYGYMFQGCTSLTTAPELPATTLASQCYQYMFQGCTSLVNALILPATTLIQSCYSGMFQNCTALTTAPVLPATTLASQCYYYMFQNCTALITAPVLPATTLPNYCYWAMFNGCTSLVNAPELPAIILAPYCYGYMFQGCTSLVNAPDLPATTLADMCYSSIFSGCKSLTTAPELSAITLSSQCYSSMFSGCTSLTAAPELPATTLANYCYQSMFSGCTSLTTAPELPATTLTESCYRSMFQDCTSLTAAPELPATVLANYCYQGMFRGCTSLNYIKICAEDIYYTASSALTSWVYNVSSTGTFVKNPFTPIYNGISGIPNGWTVQNEWPEDYNYLEFEAIDTCQFTLSIPASIGTNIIESVSYSTNKTSWTTVQNSSSAVTITTPSIAAGNKIYWRANAIATATSSENSNFTSTGRYNVNGNILSLLGNRSFSRQQYIFAKLFYNSSNLINTNNLILHTLTTYQYCYSNMFNGCTSLISIPQLYTETYPYCYQWMFANCTSLVNANINLSSTYLQPYCYYHMFDGCESLESTPIFPSTQISVQQSSCESMFEGCESLITGATILVQYLSTRCFANMYKNCISLVNAPELSAEFVTNECYYGMFKGCTSLETAPELPSTILLPKCYEEMFYGCTSLNSISMLSITSPSNDYTKDWVYGVAQSGTFEKNAIATWTNRGTNAVPNGWTIEYVGEQPIMSMWIDDFPETQQIDDALNGPELSGAPGYFYTGNTMQYNGQTCYIWQTILEEGEPWYILTTTINYQQLYNQSLENTGMPTRFTLCVAMLYEDSSIAYDENDSTMIDTTLIQIENSTPMRIWIDDFWGVCTQNILDNPEKYGANLYVYKGDTFEYDDVEYYAWEAINTSPQLLLTTTDDFDTLVDESIYESGINASFNSLFGRISPDYDYEIIPDSDQQLIKVYEY